MKNVIVRHLLRIRMTADDWKLYGVQQNMRLSYQRERDTAAAELNGDLERALNAAGTHDEALAVAASVLRRYRSWGAMEPEAHALVYELVQLRFPLKAGRPAGCTCPACVRVPERKISAT